MCSVFEGAVADVLSVESLIDSKVVVFFTGIDVGIVFNVGFVVVFRVVSMTFVVDGYVVVFKVGFSVVFYVVFISIPVHIPCGFVSS